VEVRDRASLGGHVRDNAEANDEGFEGGEQAAVAVAGRVHDIGY
jgi:hypothetical protein